MAETASASGHGLNANAQQEAAAAWTMRVKLHDISLSRNDGAEEDDFKTWSHVQLVTRGAPNSAIWYGPLDGQRQNFAFTSAANGFKKAQYNYDRGTKQAELSNQLICDLYESRLEVSSCKSTSRPRWRGIAQQRPLLRWQESPAQ